VTDSAYTVADQERMTRAKNYFTWQSRLVSPHLGWRVVEVGCGIGNFTQTLLDRETVIAVDLEAACVERLRQRYAACPNVHPVVCDLLSPEFRELKRFRPDSCLCTSVIEHTPDDAAALLAMAAVLEPGGRIVLLVPAFPSLYGPIDRRLGHYRRYRADGIRRLAERAGLAVRTAHYLNTIGFFGWWINGHILRLEAQSERQIALFDRFLVPPMAALERVIPPPFGQSVLAVLEKGDQGP
jgi:SAM-dependent methyltransferase